MVATWILPAIILAAMALPLLAAVLEMVPTRTVVWKSFWCPLKKLQVRVAFLDDAFRRERYEYVLSCSAFPQPSLVSCDKRCRDLPEAHPAPALDRATVPV
ncbi:MAG TPA: hypothetical protein VNP04_21990 [Alphaproteobacteria bacterium]|nr:hypothetical protein [Alphaproteobacteria bacterium]